MPSRSATTSPLLVLAALALLGPSAEAQEASPMGTGALPAIWADRAAFQDRLLAFQAATAGPLDAAEAGDVAAMEEAGGAVGQSCRACHADPR